MKIVVRTADEELARIVTRRGRGIGGAGDAGPKVRQKTTVPIENLEDAAAVSGGAVVRWRPSAALARHKCCMADGIRSRPNKTRWRIRPPTLEQPPKRCVRAYRI